jgi:hypothetical protein
VRFPVSGLYRHQHCRDDSVNFILLKSLGDGLDIGIVNRNDRNTEFSLQSSIRLYNQYIEQCYICEGRLTFRANTKTLCFLVATMASTIVRPILPVPPATATTTIVIDCAGKLKNE